MSVELVPASSCGDLVAGRFVPDAIVPFPEVVASDGAEGGARDGEEVSVVGLVAPFCVASDFLLARPSIIALKSSTAFAWYLVRKGQMHV